MDCTFTRQVLFGGAMSIFLPSDLLDMSCLRQIPDNQEVFANRDGSVSVMVDLLEYQADVADDEAAKFHYLQLAECNDALQDAAVNSTEVIPSTAMPQLHSSLPKSFLYGTQHAAKFNSNTKDNIVVCLGLVRLPQHTTDIVVTFNVLMPPDKNASLDIDSIRKVFMSFNIHDSSIFCC